MQHMRHLQPKLNIPHNIVDLNKYIFQSIMKLSYCQNIQQKKYLENDLEIAFQNRATMDENCESFSR